MSRTNNGIKIDGVGKDAPTVVNEVGAKQSKVLYRFDLLDPKAMFEMTKVLKEGADKYGDNNWRGIPVQDHLNHLLIHVYAYLAGDKSDDHLSHIMCRAMFAQAVDIQDLDIFSETKKVYNELITCGMCRRDTISRTEGVHYCPNCGAGHKIKIVKTSSGINYIVDTVDSENTGRNDGIEHI